jgi:asparagine synthase (glutamine-hydrolysing)
LCGITGFFNPANTHSRDVLRGHVSAMASTIVHRGPDDEGAWVAPEVGVGLGSRRLAIIDLSPEGHQPMESASGRYVITYNGEVYNAASISRELGSSGLAPRWRGHSDTEVILAAVEAWGIDRALASFNGMFAFALWDTRDRTLMLVRDRLGIKPLYFGIVNGAMVFGSELHAIAAYPNADLTINRDWLDRYLREIHIRSDETIYSQVRAVRPGTIVTFDATLQAKERAYWSLIETVEAGKRDPFAGDEAEAADMVEQLLGDAVRLRTVSDVPLGVLLSGGIDSSSVLALLQHQNPTKVHSFSIGFPHSGLDEAPAAREIAAHIGSDHTEHYMAPEDIIEMIPMLARVTDQPQSDPSYVSNHVAYRLAGETVTVALAGDGGDELFAGYHRHRWLPRVWQRMGWLPVGVREQTARAIAAVPPGSWDKAFDVMQPVIPPRFRERTPGAKLHRLARWMACASPEDMYRVLATRWDAEDRLIVGADRHPMEFELVPIGGDLGILERVLAHELAANFVDTQLMKVDRASMAVSVEARVPFMDHRMVEFAFRLPPEMKVRGETGKYILRQVLHRYVPETLYQRPKMGFHLPLGTWLRGPLRDWAESLLDAERIRQEGLLDPEPIRVKWQEHLSGRRDRVDHLWPVLMLESWLRN